MSQKRHTTGSPGEQGKQELTPCQFFCEFEDKPESNKENFLGRRQIVFRHTSCGSIWSPLILCQGDGPPDTVGAEVGTGGLGERGTKERRLSIFRTL